MLDQSGICRVARSLSTGAVVLCFHNVVAGPYQNDERSLHMRVELFEALSLWIASHLRVVPLEELAQRQARGLSLRGLAAITFDDAYRGVLENAVPVLERLELPATIFVPVEAVELGYSFWWDWPGVGAKALQDDLRRVLLDECQGDRELVRARLGLDAGSLAGEYLPATWEELGKCRGPLIDFGSHTVRHRCLPRLEEESLKWELVESARRIAEHLGVRPHLLAYPYGSADSRVARVARDAGYDAAFCLGGGRIGVTDSPLLLPRVNVPGGISEYAFRAWASGFGGRS